MKKALVLVVLVVVLFSGCMGGSGSIYWELTAEEANFILPNNAINIENKGNGWIQFDLDDNTYLLP